MTLYEDFQCPACQAFEQLSGPTLKSYVDKGTVKVAYRPIAILDRFSSTDYSSRALNAVGADVGPCINNATYKAWAARVTDQSSKDGVNGTPTVKVNGVTLDDKTPQGLTAAVEAAAKK